MELTTAFRESASACLGDTQTHCAVVVPSTGNRHAVCKQLGAAITFHYTFSVCTSMQARQLGANAAHRRSLNTDMRGLFTVNGLHHIQTLKSDLEVV